MRIRAAAVAARDALARPSDRACCVYARAVLGHAYGLEAINRADVELWHLIRDGRLGPALVGPWAPVDAACRAGLALVSSIPSTPSELPLIRPGHWHLMQGWRGVPLARGVTGHTWLWHATTEDDGELLDSTESRGPRHAGLQRWSELVSTFRGGIAVAVLRPVVG